MGDTAVAAIVTAIATVISVLVGFLTNRASAKATMRNADVSSRTDIEKEAFSRAEAFYKGAMDRQDSEIARQDREITECHEENKALKAEVELLKTRVKSLEEDLTTAQRALRLRYPDE